LTDNNFTLIILSIRNNQPELHLKRQFHTQNRLQKIWGVPCQEGAPPGLKSCGTPLPTLTPRCL